MPPNRIAAFAGILGVFWGALPVVASADAAAGTATVPADFHRPAITGAWQSLFSPRLPGPKRYMNDHTVYRNPVDGTWHVIGISGGGSRQEKSLAHGSSPTLLGEKTEHPVIGRHFDADGTPLDAWAPHAVEADGLTWLFYHSNRNRSSIELETSPDLVNWTQRRDCTMDVIPWVHRDPMILKVGDTYFMYFSDLYGGRSSVGYGTSTDLIHWTYRGPVLTTSGTATHVRWSAAESPFVIKEGDTYYLAVTLTDGRPENYHQTLVFRSPNPANFGDYNGDKSSPPGANLVTELPVHAPEFVHDPAVDQWYVTTAGWENLSLYPEAKQGVAIAELTWLPVHRPPPKPHGLPEKGRQLWLTFDDAHDDAHDGALADTAQPGRFVQSRHRPLLIENGVFNGGTFLNRTDGDFITLASSTLPGDFTLSFWINVTGLDLPSLALLSGDHFALTLQNGVPRLVGDHGNILLSAKAVLPGKWTHLLLTRSRGELVLQLNGATVATASWPDPFAPRCIGKAGADFFHGSLDDFVLYDRCLPPEDIAILQRR